ncbi:MAG: EMC3/TMCO1 family protein [Candidatus Nanoarchaeia archaeon]
MVFSSFLDPVLLPFLKLPPILAIILLSLMISLLMVIAYKLLTNQAKMKELKDKQKDFQKRMKAQKKDPQKLMKMQKEAMVVNLEYMKHSMKPTLFTFIPIIIIFGWMSAHLAFAPIIPGETFTTSVVLQEGTSGIAELTVPDGVEIVGEPAKTITGNVVEWQLKGDAGNYLLDYKINDQIYSKELLITDEQRYTTPVSEIGKGGVESITIGNQKLEVLNILGWKLGWLGTYFILALVFSMSLRKLMKVY